MRFTRSSLLEALRQDYVRTARAKGLSAGRVVWRHALRNALIPVVTVVGLSLPHAGRRRRPDRDRVRLAGHRPAGGGRGVRARLSGDHGRQPDGGRRSSSRRICSPTSPTASSTRGSPIVRRRSRPRWSRPSAGSRWAALVVACMLATGLLAPAVAPYSYSTPVAAPAAASRRRTAHWLGTDGFGRDVLSRVIWGSRVSLQIGFLATGSRSWSARRSGSVAGYFGGAADTAIMRAGRRVHVDARALPDPRRGGALRGQPAQHRAGHRARSTWAPVGPRRARPGA